MTQLVAAIRRVRRLVPVPARLELTAHDYDEPGKPVCAWDDSDAKKALVSGLVNDALAVLAAVEGIELDAVQADALGLLALVAVRTSNLATPSGRGASPSESRPTG